MAPQLPERQEAPAPPEPRPGAPQGKRAGSRTRARREPDSRRGRKGNGAPPPKKPLRPSGEPTPARRELPAASGANAERFLRPEADGSCFVSLLSYVEEEMGCPTPPPPARPPPAAPAPRAGHRPPFPAPPARPLFLAPPAAAPFSLDLGGAPNQENLGDAGPRPQKELLLPALHPRVTSSLVPSGRSGRE